MKKILLLPVFILLYGLSFCQTGDTQGRVIQNGSGGQEIEYNFSEVVSNDTTYFLRCEVLNPSICDTVAFDTKGTGGAGGSYTYNSGVASIILNDTTYYTLYDTLKLNGTAISFTEREFFTCKTPLAPIAVSNQESASQGDLLILDVLNNDIEQDSPIDPSTFGFIANGLTSYTSPNGNIYTFNNTAQKVEVQVNSAVSDTVQYTVKDLEGDISNIANIIICVSCQPVCDIEINSSIGNGTDTEVCFSLLDCNNSAYTGDIMIELTREDGSLLQVWEGQTGQTLSNMNSTLYNEMIDSSTNFLLHTTSDNFSIVNNRCITYNKQTLTNALGLRSGNQDRLKWKVTIYDSNQDCSNDSSCEQEGFNFIVLTFDNSAIRDASNPVTQSAFDGNFYFNDFAQYGEGLDRWSPIGSLFSANCADLFTTSSPGGCPIYQYRNCDSTVMVNYQMGGTIYQATPDSFELVTSFQTFNPLFTQIYDDFKLTTAIDVPHGDVGITYTQCDDRTFALIFITIPEVQSNGNLTKILEFFTIKGCDATGNNVGDCTLTFKINQLPEAAY